MDDQARLIVAMGVLVAAMLLYSFLEIKVGRKQSGKNKPSLEVND